MTLAGDWSGVLGTLASLQSALVAEKDVQVAAENALKAQVCEGAARAVENAIDEMKRPGGYNISGDRLTQQGL